LQAITSMEDALLRPSPGAPYPETVNAAFRVAHSNKAGVATFGFAECASFTHTFETLLDDLRGQRMPITFQTCDLLLKSVDVAQTGHIPGAAIL